MLSRDRLWEHAKWLYRDGWRAADKQLLMETLPYDDSEFETILVDLQTIEKEEFISVKEVTQAMNQLQPIKVYDPRGLLLYDGYAGYCCECLDSKVAMIEAKVHGFLLYIDIHL